MPAKKPTPLADRSPLTLSEKQRDSLVHATRLKRAIKNRPEGVTAGTRTVLFTRRELELLGDEIFDALPFAPKPDKQRLNAILDKVDDLLDVLEGQALLARRESADKSGSIYQLKVTLKGSKPPIWRRILLPDVTLGQLHEILQVVMGWSNSHLHQFIVRGEHYSMSPEDDLDNGMETRHEESLLISQIATAGRKVRFIYEYDFGDDWQHEVVLEKTLEPGAGLTYPLCLEGKRACPPEDCGGVWGYAGFLEAMSDSKHPNHREMKAWIGGRFDPEEFSVESVNGRLKSLR